MSLFGGNTGGGSGGGGLFGSSANQNTGSSGGGLFGSSTNQNTGSGGGGLLGPSTNQSGNTGGGLFGSSTNQNQNSTTGGGLFGSNVGQNSNTGGGLFGSNTNQSGNTGGGLFGSSTAQNKPAGGLFGSSAAQTGTSTGGGLFGTGATQNTQANTGGGLFGSSTAQSTQRNTGGGLFGGQSNTGGALGGLLGNQNASNTQNQSSNSAFGGTSMFGTQTQAQPPFSNTTANSESQQQQQQPLSSSMFHPHTVSVGQSGHTMTQAQLQKLQFSGMSTTPNEKRVAEQIRTVYLKWDPNIQPTTTVLKTWLYNTAPKEYAPFFYPNEQNGEDQASWEEALSRKPEPVVVDGKEINSTWVPVLVKGFEGLNQRVKMQHQIVQEMRTRLHEMNNSLTTIMDAHQQRITVKIAAAKRQHQVLSQRVLKLAVKVQVLRNRGYALDTAEENLRKTLMSLEKQVMDPGFVGREDEVWARMLSLRERARWLEEEGKRVTEQLNTQNQQAVNRAASSGVPEEVLNKTKKILKDYEGQLQHLNKELEDVKKEYQEWEEAQKQRGA
ncbi:Nucleoporin NUP57 [Lecanosticta acicola]|uniref:Nucleoporin NUP57 n=1 Tax=Lecanosticta acicola TaxID=111012 RepID=A0AAI8Z7F8_9PEZI|nr:Nucleoporin NUP57 [Lecanosticta acicola]